MPITDDAPAFERQGFLREDFRLFHLKDKVSPSYEFHYHDFLKIMVLLEGRVNYVIEGRSYILHPFDIVLVGRGQIHRPEVDSGQPYERQILYLSQDFLDRHRDLAKVMIGPHGDLAFVNRLKDQIEKRTLQVLESAQSDANYKYLCSFIITGCVGVVETWLKESNPQSPEEMAEILGAMLLRQLNFAPGPA